MTLRAQVEKETQACEEISEDPENGLPVLDAYLEQKQVEMSLIQQVSYNGMFLKYTHACVSTQTYVAGGTNNSAAGARRNLLISGPRGELSTSIPLFLGAVLIVL